MQRFKLHCNRIGDQCRPRKDISCSLISYTENAEIPTLFHAISLLIDSNDQRFGQSISFIEHIGCQIRY